MDLNELTEQTISEEETVETEEAAPAPDIFADWDEPEFKIGDVTVYLSKVPPLEAMEIVENLKWHLSGIVQSKVTEEQVQEFGWTAYQNALIPSLLELKPEITLALRVTMFKYIKVTVPDKKLRGQYISLKDDNTVNAVFDLNKEGMDVFTLHKVLLRSLVYNFTGTSLALGT